MRGFRCFLRAVTFVAAHLIKKPRIDRPGFFFLRSPQHIQLRHRRASRGMMSTPSTLDLLVRSLRFYVAAHSVSGGGGGFVIEAGSPSSKRCPTRRRRSDGGRNAATALARTGDTVEAALATLRRSSADRHAFRSTAASLSERRSSGRGADPRRLTMSSTTATSDSVSTPASPA